jgi:hypothetical protein
MIIRYFYIIGVAINKFETYPPLVVDRKGLLPFPIAFERMQPVAGQYFQIFQASRKIYIFQATNGPFNKIRRNSGVGDVPRIYGLQN